MPIGCSGRCKSCLSTIVEGIKKVDAGEATLEDVAVAAKEWPGKISWAIYSSERALGYVAYAAEQLPGKVSGLKAHIEAHPLDAKTLGESSDKLQATVGQLTDRLESIKNLALELADLWKKHEPAFAAKFGATPAPAAPADAPKSE
jgi:hypothetical protein